MTRVWAIGLVLLTTGTGTVWARQDVTFRATADAVQVDVLVSGRSGPVVGLTAEDFDVRDNGVRQQVRAVAFDDVPVNLALVLDLSESVRRGDLDGLRRAAVSAIEALDAGDSAAVITFGAKVAIANDFVSDRPAAIAAIERVEPIGGETSLRDAIYAALVLADDRPGRPLVLVVSDGVDVGSVLTEARLHDAVRRTRSLVFGIVPEPAPSTRALREICRMSGGRLVSLDGGTDLGAAFADVLALVRRRYLLTYSPAGVELAGWHEVTVTVPTARDATIEARPGYFVAP